MAKMGLRGHCFACGEVLKPVFPDEISLADSNSPDFVQYDNALPIAFDGGYGMFHDDTNNECRYEIVICHECAHELCRLVPWANKLIKPHNSHSHNVDYVKEHPDHWGWDYDDRA